MLRLGGTFVLLRVRTLRGALALGLLLGSLTGCSRTRESQLPLGDYQNCQNAYCHALADFYNRPIDWRIVLDMSRSYSKDYDVTLVLLRKLVDELPATPKDQLYLDTFAEDYTPESTDPEESCDLSPADPGGGSVELEECLYRLFEARKAARNSDPNKDPFAFTNLPNVVKQIANAIEEKGPGLCNYVNSSERPGRPERRQFFLVVTDGDNDPRPSPTNPTPNRHLKGEPHSVGMFAHSASGLFLPRPTSPSICNGFPLPVSGASFLITATLSATNAVLGIPSAINKDWRGVVQDLAPLIPSNFPRKLLYVRYRQGEDLKLQDHLRKATFRQSLTFPCRYPGSPASGATDTRSVLTPENLTGLSALSPVAKACTSWSTSFPDLVLPDSSLFSGEGHYIVDTFLLGLQPTRNQCRYLARSISDQTDSKNQCFGSSNLEPSTIPKDYSWKVIKDPVTISKSAATLAGVIPPAVVSLEMNTGTEMPQPLPLYSITVPQGILGQTDLKQLAVATILLFFGLLTRYWFHWLTIKINLAPAGTDPGDPQVVGSTAPSDRTAETGRILVERETSARATISSSTGRIERIVRPRPLEEPDRDKLGRNFIVDALVLGSEVFVAVWCESNIRVENAKLVALNDNTNIWTMYPRSFLKAISKDEQDLRHSWEGKLHLRISDASREDIYSYCIYGFPNPFRKFIDIPSLALMCAALVSLVMGRLTELNYWLLFFAFLLSAGIAYTGQRARESELEWVREFASARIWTPVCRITCGFVIPVVYLLWFWTDSDLSAPHKVVALFVVLLFAGVGCWRLQGTPKKVLIKGRNVSEAEFWLSPALWMLPHISKAW